MNNREKDIILSNFQNAFMVNELLKIDKQEVLREYRYLLPILNLKKEMVEQEVTITLIYADIDCYKFKAKQVNAGLLITEDAEYFSFIS